MAKTYRFRGTFEKVTDGQNWVRPFKRHTLTKPHDDDWLEWNSAWKYITHYRENIRRPAQVRRARRTNRLICRQIIPEWTLINWKRGYY